MPTIILIDVSLSMCRQASRRTNTTAPQSEETIAESPKLKQLAKSGVIQLCEYFAQNSQLEHVALVVFSSLYEIKHTFTRDHESVKASALHIETYDKSNVVNAIRGLLTMKLDEWAQDGPVNILLITDGQIYNTDMSLDASKNHNHAVDYEFRDIPLHELEGQFNFDCKIQIVCLTSPRDPSLKLSLPFYKKLASIIDGDTTVECPVLIGSNNLKNFKRSAIWLPESSTLDITKEEVGNVFTNIAEYNYKPYHVVLSCGHMSSMVMLSPKPTDCLVEPLKNEFDDLKNEESSIGSQQETLVSALNKTRLFELSDEFIIVGFMPLGDIASPAVTSKHIVFPVPNEKFNEISKAEQILSRGPNACGNSLQTPCGPVVEHDSQDGPTSGETGANSSSSSSKTKLGRHSNHSHQTNSSSDRFTEKDITKKPSFCVFLHNCLKQENMAAICIVGKNEDTHEEWFGVLHPHTDARKRSCLMLSLLLPGPCPILWLPNFKTLGSATLNADLPPAILERLVSNVNGGSSSGSGGKGGSNKSYSSNNVIWLDPESVQADVQKVVRHAKRAPDKVPHFYKELNRIRRAALSYGFFDVLYGLASILEREKSTLTSDPSKPINQEVIKHLDHVICCLRTRLTDESFETNIVPPTC